MNRLSDISRPGVACCCLPERAADRPAVEARVQLELVGVGVQQRLAVQQPHNIWRVLLLAAPTPQGTVQGHRFTQRGDDGGGASLELQI